MDLGKIDAEMKKGIDARTKEFREKLTKLTYEKIKAKLKPSTHPLKGYPHNESIDEARKMPKNPAIDNDPKVKAARKDHAAGIWDGNVDKEGEAIVFVKGKPHTVTNKYESIEESAGDAVQGLNDLGNKMKGRDQKDIRRIEKLYRSGNSKVFQGAIRALDTDLRDQVKDIFDALGMVKQGVIESVDLTEGKMKEFHGYVKAGKSAEWIAKKIGLDVKDVKDFMKDMVESKKLSKVSDMTERAMTLKQLASKYKGDIAKAQKSGNADSLKKAEKELTTWAMSNNEIGNAKEADDWLSNVVADKDQFAALLKFSNS